jgi:hypothetical protein
MKIILLFLILCVGLKAQNAYYALVDSNNVVFEVFVANPTIAANPKQIGTQSFPNAVLCIPALNSNIGWTYDPVTQTFTPPVDLISVNQNSEPVVITTNNAAVTTNNAVK